MPGMAGTSGADYLVSPGGYAVDGGAGDDVIVSGGDDTLTGGPGADIFVFPRGTTWGTVITDFGPEDKLAFDVPPGAKVQGVTPGTDAVYAIALRQLNQGFVDVYVLERSGGVNILVDSYGDNTVGDTLVLNGPYNGRSFHYPDDTSAPPSFVVAPPPPPATAPPPLPAGGGLALQGGVLSETLRGDSLGDIILGGGGNDSLFGKEGADTLGGEFGYDTLQGGAGADRLTGGGDHNVFVISGADSPAQANQAGALDVITDWNATDFIKVIGGTIATQTNFASLGAAADYAAAFAMAQDAFLSRAADYATVQVGGDVFLFAPGVGAAVQLAGASLADIGYANLGMTPPPVTDVQPPLRTVSRATDADDVMQSTLLENRLDGGIGNDTIVGTSSAGTPYSNYLRGGDGNDAIYGAADFDDINGNKGDDIIVGGPGDDWLVGGQGDDRITSLGGAPILYGNLGNDTLYGGSGADLIRGGQADDRLAGGLGDDWLSGDRGNDTVVGGGGADVFHTFNGAGLDLVTDFHAAEGDRVMLDPGTTYSLRQQGSDTIVDLGNGDQMVLKNVVLADLPAGWIFGA